MNEVQCKDKAQYQEKTVNVSLTSQGEWSPTISGIFESAEYPYVLYIAADDCNELLHSKVAGMFSIEFRINHVFVFLL